MKKLFRLSLAALTFASVLFLGIYIINEPPWIIDKTVLDIRNNSKTDLKGMYLSVEKSSTFTVPNGETYYDKKIFIPTVYSGERVVVILNQGSVAAPGMQLRLNCNEFDDIIDDELHKDSGELHIVSVDKNDKVHHQTVYNRLNQGMSLFSLKRYRMVDVTPE